MEFYSGKKRNEGMSLAGEMVLSELVEQGGITKKKVHVFSNRCGV